MTPDTREIPTLESALNLDESALQALKNDLKTKIQASDLNAYIADEAALDSHKRGVPVLIKDNISVKGWEITCASRILKGYKAPYSATAVENLLAKGFAPFGRANMDEFAMGSTTESSAYGATKNPHDKTRVPGGSSGGSAAAVAGGLAIAALGSDTGGSIRQPAGYCGCVGLKPTYGAVSRYGLVAYSSSLDVIGPITQNVRDCALLFDAIKGQDFRDSTSAANAPSAATLANLNPARKMKVGILKGFLKDANTEIQAAYYDVVGLLERLGYEIIETEMLDTSFHISTYYIISMAEASSNLARFDGVRYGNRTQKAQNLKDLYVKTRSEGFGEEVKRRILIGNFVLSSGYYDAYYLRAQRIRDYISSQMREIFSRVDVLLSPVAPSVAPKIGENLSPLEMYLSDIYTIGANLSGIPALSLPVAKNGDGLPIGMQFLGRHFGEQDILDIAFAVESALK